MAGDRDDLIGLSDYAFGRLRDRMAGLTDLEYRWEPVAGCRSIRQLDDGRYASDGPSTADPPPVTTLAWRLCHIVGLLQEDRNGPWLGRPEQTLDGWAQHGLGAVGTAAEVLAALDAAHAMWRGIVAATTDASLAQPMGSLAGPYAASSRRSFVLHVLDELIHHGAEAALFRDLYRAR